MTFARTLADSPYNSLTSYSEGMHMQESIPDFLINSFLVNLNKRFQSGEVE